MFAERIGTRLTATAISIPERGNLQKKTKEPSIPERENLSKKYFPFPRTRESVKEPKNLPFPNAEIYLKSTFHSRERGNLQKNQRTFHSRTRKFDGGDLYGEVVKREAAVLDGFAEMFGGDVFVVCQVGDGAGDFENAVITARRKPEFV